MSDTLNVADLEREIRLIADRAAVIDLISRLGRVLDAQSIDQLGTIFTDDVTGQFAAGPFSGLDKLVDYAEMTIPAFSAVQHMITNVLVELDGDRAVVHANLLSVNVPKGAEPSDHFDLGGVYRFETVREPVGWKISRVEVGEVWTSGTMDAEWLEKAKYSAPASS